MPHLPALESLYLSGTKVADLMPLQELPQLRTVYGDPKANLDGLNAARRAKGMTEFNRRSGS